MYYRTVGNYPKLRKYLDMKDEISNLYSTLDHSLGKIAV